MIRQERIGSFNPFNLKNFRCPVCGSNDFTELVPYGGVWCDECNAQFFVRGTCDGVNKIVVDCFTKWVHRHKRTEDMLDYYGAVIWKEDEKITWLGWKKDEKKLFSVDPNVSLKPKPAV